MQHVNHRSFMSMTTGEKLLRSSKYLCPPCIVVTWSAGALAVTKDVSQRNSHVLGANEHRVPRCLEKTQHAMAAGTCLTCSVSARLSESVREKQSKRICGSRDVANVSNAPKVSEPDALLPFRLILLS